jgi:hypothetical protein
MIFAWAQRWRALAQSCIKRLGTPVNSALSFARHIGGPAKVPWSLSTLSLSLSLSLS